MAHPDSTLITHIGELVINDDGAGAFAARTDAALVIAEGRVAWTGPASQAPAADAMVDAGGRAVLPGFVDSHAHLVFAGERSAEFAARMAGRPYQAGGILTTVEATRAATDEALRANLARLAAEMARQGTTTLECKSGYGLTVADEGRGLAAGFYEVTLEVTYLGAHVVLPEFGYDPAGHVGTWCAARCWRPARRTPGGSTSSARRGAFGAQAAAAILAAGRAAGLLAPDPRQPDGAVTRGQGGRRGGRRVGRPLHVPDRRRRRHPHLRAGGLDAAPRRGDRHQAPVPGRAAIARRHGCHGGPGHRLQPRFVSDTSSMPFCIALAVRDMGMTTQEAVWAATAGGARALRRPDVGHLGLGARADLILLDAPSHVYLAYRPGVPQIAAVWQAGRLVAGSVTRPTP